VVVAVVFDIPEVLMIEEGTAPEEEAAAVFDATEVVGEGEDGALEEPGAAEEVVGATEVVDAAEVVAAATVAVAALRRISKYLSLELIQNICSQNTIRESRTDLQITYQAQTAAADDSTNSTAVPHAAITQSTA
jgi:hypothetical protein